MMTVMTVMIVVVVVEQCVGVHHTSSHATVHSPGHRCKSGRMVDDDYY